MEIIKKSRRIEEVILLVKWKPVVGYENKYMVSDRGDIFSIGRKKILNPKVNWDNYLRIQLWRKNKNKYVSIHRIVCESFLGVMDENMVVNHKNGIKNDNRLDNLEWVTQKENIIHSWNNGLSKHKLNNINPKSVKQYTLDGEYIATFASQKQVERDLGISHVSISSACRGKTKTAGGYVWKFNSQK